METKKSNKKLIQYIVILAFMLLFQFQHGKGSSPTTTKQFSNTSKVFKNSTQF